MMMKQGTLSRGKNRVSPCCAIPSYSDFLDSDDAGLTLRFKHLLNYVFNPLGTRGIRTEVAALCR